MARNKRLDKIYNQCRTLLRCFVDTVATECAEHNSVHRHAVLTSSEEAADRVAVVVDRLLGSMCEDGNGFVVLNGGLSAGCSPYTLRCYLIEAGVMSALQEGEPGDQDRIPTPCVFVGSTLPFAIITRPLCTRDNGSVRCAMDSANESTLCNTVASSLSMTDDVLAKDDIIYPIAVDITYRLRTKCGSGTRERLCDVRSADNERCSCSSSSDHTNSSSSHATAHSARRVISYVMQMSHGRRLRHGSSSTKNDGSGLLFFVRCDAAEVMRVLQPRLQRAVLGIEPLLREHYTVHVNKTVQQNRQESDGQGQQHEEHEQNHLKVTQLLAEHALACEAFPCIPGLFAVPDFLTVQEEKDVMFELGEPWIQNRIEQLARRRVAHFSYRFLYGVNQLVHMQDKAHDTPRFFTWMQRRLGNADLGTSIASPYPIARATRRVSCVDGISSSGCTAPARSAARACPDVAVRDGEYEDVCTCEESTGTRALCDQLTINFYDYDRSHGAGKVSGIAAHVDAHSPFGDMVFIVSLGSYSVMEFTRFDQPASCVAPHLVYLAPRSLVMLSGEARYAWRHSISERRTDHLSELLPSATRGSRVSLTWRRHREGTHDKSTCSCPPLCDGVECATTP